MVSGHGHGRIDGYGKSGTFAYQPDIAIHPGCWFDLANNPENQITFIDDTKALIRKPGYEITVDGKTANCGKSE